MPTPVSTARQCLTDEAARALDAAVAIARRRSHTQTTSLHALSALLSLPSSPLLRYACSRSHCTPYSPRLQFRALELCVGVSLDRLPTTKTSTHHHQPDHHEDDNHNSPSPSSSPPPPISNSLMAAIKRSQANQRRQPEMYQITHFHHSNPSVNPISSISAIKVELKNFVISILDDPIISRVLGEAGFRSHDIKLAILHPPVPPPSSPAARFLRAAAAASRFPPPLLSVPFPFATAAGGEDDSGGYYSRRIGEILVKRSGSGRNPLLIGVCAREALMSFRECVEQRKPGGLLPTEVTGVGFVCLEEEIQGFVTGCEGREKIESKIDELDSILEKHGGPGLVVSYGDLKVLVADDPGGLSDSTKFLVSKLSGLVKRFKEKLWLIGWAASSDTCKKFQELFPSLENEWDLQSLPVTSSRSTVGGLYSKSSLMGSFVPFGGFFSSPSEFRNNHPLGVINSSPSTGSSSRCALCNEKCDQELLAMKKSSGSSSTSLVSAAADRCSSSTLPSWLQTKESSNTSKPQEEISDKAAELRLQEKWNETCQRLHHPLRTPNNPELSITSRSQVVPCSVGFLNAARNFRKSISDGGNPLPSDRLSSSLDSSTQIMVQKSTSSLPSLAATPAVSASLAENVSEPVSVTSRSFAYHSPNRNLPNEHKSPPSVSSVTTDLGLGAVLHAASTTCQEPKITGSSHVGRGVWGKFSSTAPSTHPPDVAVAIAISSKKSVEGCDHYKRDYRYVVEDPEDYKQILKKLTERVPWQVEACQNISRMLSSFRCGRKGNNGHGPPFNQQHSVRGLWMVLSGPDKIGKKKVGSAIADVVFGSRESLIAVDLSSQDKRVMREPSNLIFDSSMLLLPNDLGVRSGRKTVVDYLVDELRRKPHSVVVIENVDQSDDLVVQRSLSRAIQTGRLPDSHGREISISNAIFVMTTGSRSIWENDDGDDEDGDRPQMRFTEERVLDAQIWQMKIAVELVDDGGRNFNHSNDKRPRVAVMDSNMGSHHHVSKRRRSHSDVSTSMIVQKKTRRCLLDLNVALPVEEIDESTESDSSFPDPSSRAWWAEFEHQVEEKVEFKTVHFNMMAAKLMNLISGRLESILGEGVGLEIDEEAMVMILGAAWSSEKEGAVEGWVEEVLGGAFKETRRRHYIPEGGSSVILKLVSCPGNRVDKRAPGICLPGSINLG